MARLRQLEDDSIAQNNTIAHLNEQVRQARDEAAKWRNRLQQKEQQSKGEHEKLGDFYKRKIDELNQEIESQKNQIEEQQPKTGHTGHEHSIPSKITKPTSSQPGLITSLREQLVEKEEQQQKLIHSLAEIRADMVKIAEGNLNAISEDERQNLSIQALIVNRTAQLQEKIDDYEVQLRTLKQELKAQKDRNQQFIDEAKDARERLGRESESE